MKTDAFSDILRMSLSRVFFFLELVYVQWNLLQTEEILSEVELIFNNCIVKKTTCCLFSGSIATESIFRFE